MEINVMHPHRGAKNEYEDMEVEHLEEIARWTHKNKMSLNSSKS